MNPYQRRDVNYRLAFPDPQLQQGCQMTCEFIDGLYFNNDNNDCKKKATMITYTATGALLGTPLLPPVGTIVGGLIGMSIGLIKTLANDCIHKYEELRLNRIRNQIQNNQNN